MFQKVEMMCNFIKKAGSSENTDPYMHEAKNNLRFYALKS